jgi:N-acetylmuramoyl-L-alanine amidase
MQFAVRESSRLTWLALTALWFLAFASFAAPSHAQGIDARDFRIAGDATRVRVVVEFDGEPDLRWLLLRGPHRLVIELPQTRFMFKPKSVKAHGLMRDVRYGAVGADAARIIFATKGPFAVANAEVVPNEDGNGHRMILEIAAASEAEFEAALADQSLTTAATVAVASKGGRIGPSVDRPAQLFTIVVDPGHGGADGGANGTNGTVEKDITLAFARQLRDALSKNPTYDVQLTRDSDEFLRLDDRVRIARQKGANLFISIHADTINVRAVRGATVYTVSDKASDAEAQALADRENLADQIGGIDVEAENHEVADILIDLIRRETHAFSIRFARTLVGELSDSIGVIKNPHRFAGFKVLKAPDVPSVLVELGYLSNPKDEEQLKNPEWRGKAVGAIVNSVAEFAASAAAGR